MAPEPGIKRTQGNGPFPIAGIIEYNDVKELFDTAIKADRPVHILLVSLRS